MNQADRKPSFPEAPAPPDKARNNVLPKREVNNDPTSSPLLFFLFDSLFLQFFLLVSSSIPSILCSHVW